MNVIWVISVIVPIVSDGSVHCRLSKEEDQGLQKKSSFAHSEKPLKRRKSNTYGKRSKSGMPLSHVSGGK
jgi:hypothetical protein